MAKVIPTIIASKERTFDSDSDEEKLGMGQKSGLASVDPSSFSKVTKDRIAMREKVIKGTLETVIKDFGEYDVDGTADAPLEKHKGPCVRCLKVFGCWSLNLHESVMSGR